MEWRLGQRSGESPLIGSEKGVVQLVPYQPGWHKCFHEESERLRSALGHHVVHIEHVGGTAIPGMDAKAIIDIMVAVQSIADARPFEQALTPLGYLHQKANDLPGRLYFVKRRSDGRPTHHLNLTGIGSDCWRDHVSFRDYLRSHPEARVEYQRLKRDLAQRYSHDRPAYTEGKAGFVQKTLRLAKQERNP